MIEDEAQIRLAAADLVQCKPYFTVPPTCANVKQTLHSEGLWSLRID